MISVDTIVHGGIVVTMNAKEDIVADGAVALRMVHRIHIPIVTNDKVHFFINDIDHKFNVGDVIDIDNTR